jgi:hypothetical protein
MNTQITATPKLFIGMDIHKKSWSLHFRTDLFDHRGFSMPPNTEHFMIMYKKHFLVMKYHLFMKQAAVVFQSLVTF